MPILTIEIQYITSKNNKINKLFLLPNDYFDLEENETVELDSCPKYNHVIDYLESNNFLKNREILFTKILITDLKNKQHRQITERLTLTKN